MHVNPTLKMISLFWIFQNISKHILIGDLDIIMYKDIWLLGECVTCHNKKTSNAHVVGYNVELTCKSIIKFKFIIFKELSKEIF